MDVEHKNKVSERVESLVKRLMERGGCVRIGRKISKTFFFFQLDFSQVRALEMLLKKSLDDFKDDISQ